MKKLARFNFSLILRVAACSAALAAPLAHGGGAISSFVCGSSPPTKYSGTVSLNFDRGNAAGSSTTAALGTKTKAEADAIVEAAIAMWAGVTSAASPLARGSDMPVDVTSSNYTDYIAAYFDGYNPVIYDIDGTVIDSYYGAGSSASILGVAGSAVSTSGSTCSPVEGVAIINGAISSTTTLLTVTIAHELGHFMGLDHSQLDSTQGLSTANRPLMYPSAGSSSTATVKDDDKAAISAIYPSSTVYSTDQQVTGNFYLADGTTAIKGANLWLKNTADSKVYSVVSDYLKQSTGYFRFLVPPGTYNLFAEAVSTGFISGSSVGPYASSLSGSSFQSPMYSGANGTGTVMSTLTLGNATPTAIVVTTTCSKIVTFKFDGTGTVDSTCYTVPDAPLIGTATRGNAQVSVAFTAPASNGGGSITSYTATCGTQSASGTASPITVTGLTNGTAVTCTVKATNAYGTGAASSASSSVTPATTPGAPTIGTATAGNTQVSIAFTAPANNGGSAVTSYSATCGTQTATGAASPITVTGLTNGTAVTCAVKAINAVGTGSASSASSSVTPATVPGAPTIGAATAGNAQVSIAFTAPSSNGGSAITSYTATCGTQTATGTASPITVTGLTNGTAVTCSVKAANVIGSSVASGASANVTPVTVPGAPTIGTATAGNTQVSITFTAPASNGGSAITGYTATCGTQSATGTASPLVVSGLTNGTAVTCTVKASNAQGSSVASSASNSVTPATVPGAPTIGTVTSGNAQVTVAFTGPGSNGGSAVTSYTATCGTQTGANTASPIVVTGLTNGTAVTCTVTASNIIGTGSPSAASVSVTPATTPGAPTISSVTAGNAKVTVAFNAPASNGGSAITSYTATCGAQSLSGTSSPIAVTGLTNGVAVTCTVKAANAAGSGSASTASSSVTPATVPGVPTLNSITAGNGQITLTFTAPSDNGGSAIIDYPVDCGAVVGFSSVSPATFTGFTNGTAVTCRIAATNAMGTGSYSANSASVTPATVPGAPTLTSVTAGNTQVSVAFTAPGSTGGSAITGYTATCGAQSVSGTASPLVVAGLTNGTAVTCTVKATNAIGSGSASSVSASVTPATVPGAPTITVVSFDSGQVQVSFSAPTSNGGSAITTYTATCGTQSVSGNSTTLTVTGLTNGVAVTCTVTATNGVGTGAVSAASTSITPSTVPGAPTIGSVVASSTQVVVSFIAPASNGGSAITGYTATCGSVSVSGTASPITVTGLTNGIAVTCTVKATNARGTGAASAASSSVTPATVPAAPTISDASSGVGQITVSVSPSTDTGGSAIMSYSATCGSVTATSAASPVIVAGLTSGVAVTCIAKAINAIGASAASAATGSVMVYGPPTAPTITAVATGSTQVIVTVDPPSNNGGRTQFYGYTATCGTKTGYSATSPITVTGLTNGIAVSCTVVAENDIGFSVASAASVSVTPVGVPSAPTVNSVTAGNQQLTLAFTAPASNGGSTITGYVVSCGGQTATGTASPITVTGLINGVQITCTVAAINAVGTGAAATASGATPATVPGAPSIAGVNAGIGQVQVVFTAPADNGGASISQYTASCGAATASAAASPIIVSGLTNGVAVTCTVTATNAMGTSVASAASASVTPRTTPGAPTITGVAAGNTQVVVSFNAPVSNGGSTILDYTATCGGQTITGISSPLTVSGLTNGVAVTCNVTARNVAGTSVASAASASVTPATLPDAPVLTAVLSGNAQVQVSFTAPVNNGGSAIIDYTATCATQSATGAASPVTVAGLTNGVAVTCTVSARNIIGSSAPSNVSASVTPATVPGAPLITAVTAGNGQVQVAFTAPISNGGSAILNYTATCGAQSTTAAASPINVTGLTNGVAVACTLTARNIAGDSAPSTPSSFITPVSVPDAPTLSGVTAGNSQVQVSFSAPANSGGSAILDYSASCGAKSATGSNSPITVTGLANGVAVTCVVTARNAIGSSGASNLSMNVTPFTVPDAPIINTATAGNAQISVAFTAPPNNGGSAITGYTATCGSKSASNSTSPIIVTGLTDGMAVTCTVVATNAAGQSLASSASSSVTPVAPCSLDFSGDGSLDATDAILFNRWLLGFRGTALVSGLTPTPNGTSQADFAAAVTARMVLGTELDLDGDSRITAATDGLLLTRLLLGVKSVSFAQGALGPGYTRGDYAAISAHVNANCGTTFAP